jgi:simple sugar transport system ATP-binding protein
MTSPATTASSGPRTPLLEVRGISKYFGSVNALQDVSLQVFGGEVTCVLGDNGAGKSTLIKILSGRPAGTGSRPCSRTWPPFR